MNIISILWSGRAGLARTYWLWGVLFGILWGLVLSLVKPGSSIAILLVVAFFAYYIVVHVGLWRAASQYSGAKIWAILAKAVVVITPTSLIVGSILAIFIPAKHQSNYRSPQTAASQHIATVESDLASASKSSTPKGFSSDQKLLREQGVSGNQDVADVKSWGRDQLLARSVQDDDLIRAHTFAAMWQRQLIHVLKLPPERSLFLGYSIVINYLDQYSAYCRPDMKNNGGVEDVDGTNFKTHPECFQR